ncbi:MAG: HAD-IC family P-type ATPase [Chitinophagaceae bacterium]|nr:HAD-IC family P-type ATPase [Chitinophagaceae bacterium]
MQQSPISASAVSCFHCGEDCGQIQIQAHGKYFCCEGCRMVYELLNSKGLCDYYSFNQTPGNNQRIPVRSDKFQFLEDDPIQRSLISFRNDTQTHVSFYLPQVHCSSCLWLLENLHRINPGVMSSKVNFERKEATVVFDHHVISLRAVAELLTSIGYEPYISFHDMQKKKPVQDRRKIYRLGVAGFCFANIMLLSFPEYLGIDIKEAHLLNFFRYVNLGLSLPVFFYSAAEFYTSAWQALRHRFLNIDAPIVLAILVTFFRSVYEVYTGTGSGYFDSMTGIVFFMLAGRVLQDRTHKQLSFDRDYTSYFPIAVTRVNDTEQHSVSLSEIKLNDTLLIHHQELIPADGILTRGKALIDYSFVTGESAPVMKEMGEMVYAGGRQMAGNIEILVIREVAQSYLTRLWNRDVFSKEKDSQTSFVHALSRWFTWIVFAIAAIAGTYWMLHDETRMWNAITAVLIIACPCALLLSNTFTNGNILRQLSARKLYLRNAAVIENLADIDTIVFDKTGTLTTGVSEDVVYDGRPIPAPIRRKIATLAAQSTHPLSKSILQWAGESLQDVSLAFREESGKGIEGMVDGDLIAMGSAAFITGKEDTHETLAAVYLSVEGKFMGCFRFRNHYREAIPALLQELKQHYHLVVLSGDNPGEEANLRQMLGREAALYFRQQPEDKLDKLKLLQEQGHSVMMIGDGLNDSGALKQADVGMALADNTNHFTPASDAIIDAQVLPKLYRFIQLCRANRRIVMAAFLVSIVYNITGLWFAVQGNLSPMIAAILMPSSSLSILLITYGFSNMASRKLLPET